MVTKTGFVAKVTTIENKILNTINLVTEILNEIHNTSNLGNNNIFKMKVKEIEKTSSFQLCEKQWF